MFSITISFIKYVCMNNSFLILDSFLLSHSCNTCMHKISVTCLVLLYYYYLYYYCHYYYYYLLHFIAQKNLKKNALWSDLWPDRRLLYTKEDFLAGIGKVKDFNEKVSGNITIFFFLLS